MSVRRTHDRPSLQVGDHGNIDGLEWRVLAGKKRPGDKVIEFRAPAWVRIKMAVGFLLTDFLYQNEDVLFPPPKQKGGQKYMEYLRISVRQGWERAADYVATDRRLRRLEVGKQKQLFDEDEA